MQCYDWEDTLIPIAHTITHNIIEIYPLLCDNNTIALNEIELTTSITIYNIENNTFDIESHEMVVQSCCPSSHSDIISICNILHLFTFQTPIFLYNYFVEII